MKSLSPERKKILYLVGAILIIVLTYFFVYQKNMDRVLDYEMQNSKLTNRVQYLQSLQPQVTELEAATEVKTEKIEEYTQGFAPVLTQEKAIYHIYSMSISSNVRVTSVEVGNTVDFYKSAQVGKIENAETQATNEQNSQESGNETAQPEETDTDTKLPLEQMTGSMMTYTVGIEGSYKSIMSAMDWVRKNDEHMSIGATNIAYDSSTGKLTGTMDVNFYAMKGNGKAYEEPPTSGFSFGEKNVFGTVK